MTIGITVNLLHYRYCNVCDAKSSPLRAPFQIASVLVVSEYLHDLSGRAIFRFSLAAQIFVLARNYLFSFSKWRFTILGHLLNRALFHTIQCARECISQSDSANQSMLRTASVSKTCFWTISIGASLINWRVGPSIHSFANLHQTSITSEIVFSTLFVTDSITIAAVAFLVSIAIIANTSRCMC